jgi:hypothetical protein
MDAGIAVAGVTPAGRIGAPNDALGGVFLLCLNRPSGATRNRASASHFCRLPSFAGWLVCA